LHRDLALDDNLRPTFAAKRKNQPRASPQKPAPSAAEGMGHPLYREGKKKEIGRATRPAPSMEYGNVPSGACEKIDFANFASNLKKSS
jgi:hypothetical protein